MHCTQLLRLHRDLHGDLKDLCTILDNGLPSAEHTIVFNGDFVDRGPFSFEVFQQLGLMICVQIAGECGVLWKSAEYCGRVLSTVGEC